MKLLTVVGARPQFIKAAAVSRVLRRRATEVLLHTGQHYDYGMSEVFFRELSLPAPDYNLGVGSGNHGAQTAQMITAIEEIILKEKPDIMLVYGDTNSTLAGALSAVKLHIPIAHVEAGLRSYKKTMPEEINRVLTDHCSALLFCPTSTAVVNLAKEGITGGVHNVGDVMYDALLYYTADSAEHSAIFGRLSISPRHYYLATIHRAENTDKPERLSALIEAVCEAPEPVVLPLHPRTRAIIAGGPLEDKLKKAPHVTITEPVGYLEMLQLEKHARAIVTDSGGIQKEAYLLGVPCITLRDETEWVETVEAGANILAGARKEIIVKAMADFTLDGKERPPFYGDGRASEKITDLLCNFIDNETAGAGS
jgi:UDP-N-acetylglucosamine 2-epimerase